MEPDRRIDLHLFHLGPEALAIAAAAGVDAVVVDCEEAGKRHRQHGYDTEINRWRPEECGRVRDAAPGLRVVCRINGFREVGNGTLDEARAAVDAGAHEVLVPMVERLEEVDAVLDAVAGRAEVGVMIETGRALELVGELDRRPLRRAFVGLNDLMIERGTTSLFGPLLDGTVEDLRARIRSMAFGFGGMTLPERGHPVPARLMIAELARLRCDFTFLRRSFYRDLAATGLAPAEMVARLRAAWADACRRPPERIAADRTELQEILQSIAGDGR